MYKSIILTLPEDSAYIVDIYDLWIRKNGNLTMLKFVNFVINNILTD